MGSVGEHTAELPGTLGGLPEEALVDPITELGAESWVRLVALLTVHQAWALGNLAA